MRRLCPSGAVLGAAAACLLGSPARAGDPVNFLIPISDDNPGTDVRTDFVFDNTRGQLLISKPHGGVERFDMGTHSFLAPWNVGTRLRAIDITPDGSRVLLAESTTLAGPMGSRIGRVHSIDAATGAATQITWETNYTFGGGVGAYAVAITSNGKAFVTPDWIDVSGAEYLREINLANNTVQLRTDLPFTNGRTRDSSGLALGIDRSHMLVWEGDTSSPSAAIYSAATNSFGARTGHYIYGNFSPDGQRLAAQYYDGSTPAVGREVDLGFNSLVDLPGTSLTYTFDPIRPVIYYADRSTAEFVTVSAVTGAVISQFHPGDSFDSALRLTVSADGQWAFVRVPFGVRVIAIPSPGACMTLSLGLGASVGWRRRPRPLTRLRASALA